MHFELTIKVVYENPKLGVTKEFEIEIIKNKTIRVNIFMEREPGDDVKVRFIDY